MKKKAEKKLSLGKIKIVNLSRDQQQTLYGGKPKTMPLPCASKNDSCASNAFTCVH